MHAHKSKPKGDDASTRLQLGNPSSPSSLSLSSFRGLTRRSRRYFPAASTERASPAMSKQPQRRLLLFWLLSIASALHLSTADVGTAAAYRPPYIPTSCFGSDVSQFPSDNLFAAAGEGIWDNGASCGRQYLVKCLSSSVPRACPEDHPTIQIRVVDQASTSVSPPGHPGTTLALSLAAFRAITNSSAGEINTINVEFQQV